MMMSTSLIEITSCWRKRDFHNLIMDNSIARECTFKPEITGLGKIQPSKNANELCYGDAVKQLHTIQEKKAEEEVKIRNLCTFKPYTSRNNDQVDSRLNSNLEPRDYIQQLNIIQDEKECLRKFAEMKRIQKEMDECSFRPNITEVPSYIRTIRNERVQLS